MEDADLLCQPKEPAKRKMGYEVAKSGEYVKAVWGGEGRSSI